MNARRGHGQAEARPLPQRAIPPQQNRRYNPDRHYQMTGAEVARQPLWYVKSTNSFTNEGYIP